MDSSEHTDQKGEEKEIDSPAPKQKKRKSSPSHEDADDKPPSIKISKLDIASCTESSTAKVDSISEETEFDKKKREKPRDDTVPSSPLQVVRPELSGDSPEAVKEKKYVRKRFKYLLQAVSDQMEFYFSDSNLSKDRYLKKYIDQSPDGYVDLSIFGNFNKLQTLHKDGISLKTLTKALEGSKELQLSEDKTKVKRTTPFTEISADETSNRTVYVEYLPNHATHAWIQTIFSPCGKVVYISLPKYQSTGHIKGFAFVEFKTSEEAEKACKMLNNPPPLKEGERPGKFPRGNKTLNRLQKIAPEVSITTEQSSNEENVVEDPQGELGRKRKKKKKGKKKIQGEASAEPEQAPVVEKTVEVEGVEGKKKKKKKKKRKKQVLSQDEGGVKEDEPVKKEEKDIGPIVETEKQSEEKPIKKSDDNEGEEATEISLKKKRKKKKKRRASKKQGVDQLQSGDEDKEAKNANQSENILRTSESKEESTNDSIKQSTQGDSSNTTIDSSKQMIGRRERKRLRQEDIREKKRQREAEEEMSQEKSHQLKSSGDETKSSNVESKEKKMSSDRNSANNAMNLDGKADKVEAESGVMKNSESSDLPPSCLKSKRPSIQKKVEFNPVPVTQEFVREKEIRKRRKAKKDKLHLRVITKKEWLSLKAEYLNQQKSHMNALKESLRELRQQENQYKDSLVQPGPRHIDLEDVFGTKRLKLSQEVKLAHVESLKFTPNVIVQWKSSNEMHRDKIRTMFKDISGDSIAYIDSQEEAKSGYIRFKDEVSAEKFAKLSRHSNSFSARVLPDGKQKDYWDKANADRMKKLGRKNVEKGSQRIARKVFERNKVTFQEKASRIVFTDETEEEKPSE